MKAFMFTKFTAFILLLLLSVINGCTAKPAGIGSDDGASASENDQLQKNYEVDYPEAVKTSLNLLNSAEFPGGGEITDELKLEFFLQELTSLPHLVADPDVL